MPMIAVCSWSLRPAGPQDLVRSLNACGLRAVQLALDPIRSASNGHGGRRGDDWGEAKTRRLLDGAGVRVISGMMGTRGEDYTTLDSIRRTGGLRPDEHWAANLAAAEENAQLARRLGLRLVTFHAGFLPHDPADPLRRTMIERIGRVADVFGEAGITVGLETGQETAETLADLLGELARPNVGVNFDPANMILYGMGDPVAAFRLLAPHVVQVHVKDALPAVEPGEWGTETPAGEGGVDWSAFFGEVRRLKPRVDLVIERESGEDRVRDVAKARELLARHGMIDEGGPRGGA